MVYIELFRNTPLLVQLFLAYYGLPKLGITMSAFPCAVLVFSLNEGAYCSETMRSALEAVPAGQMEAGYCVGMTYWQIMRRIILPQALRNIAILLALILIIIGAVNWGCIGLFQFDLVAAFGGGTWRASIRWRARSFKMPTWTAAAASTCPPSRVQT